MAHYKCLFIIIIIIIIIMCVQIKKKKKKKKEKKKKKIDLPTLPIFGLKGQTNIFSFIFFLKAFVGHPFGG